MGGEGKIFFHKLSHVIVVHLVKISLLARSIDLNILGRHVGEAIVLEIDGGADGVAGYPGLGTRRAYRLHHVEERAARQLGGLLVGVVAGVEGGGQGDGGARTRR